jgi:hypothetical protein
LRSVDESAVLEGRKLFIRRSVHRQHWQLICSMGHLAAVVALRLLFLLWFMTSPLAFSFITHMPLSFCLCGLA